MQNSNKLYDEKSIESLSPLEFTRLRPGVYAGSTEYATQLLVEILSNAIDEFNAGHGNKIKVTIDKDIVTITDFGQGFIPNSFREDGKTILEAAFSVLNTSGKYRDDGAYEGTSLGSFGIGSKITTYLSHWLHVWTRRDGVCEHVTFQEGEFSNREVFNVNEGSGTTVQWQPSEEFFTHTEVDKNVIKKLFDTITCLCAGLEIEFTDLDKEETILYTSKNGLMDYVDKNTKDKEILTNRLNINDSIGKNKINLCLTYTSDYSSTIIPYVNTGLTDSGPHITLFKTIVTREFNKFFREKKYLKDKDENLSGDDIQEGMYLVFNLTTSGVKYDAQVKSRVTGIDVKDLAQIFTEHLQKWLIANEKDIKGIAEKALSARKAREAAKKARDAVRATGEKKSKLLNLPTKLVDAWSKDRVECELLITEGDSAASGLIAARDGKTQAVFPVRGKIISVYKNSLEKILSNQEVVNIIKALGLEIDKKNNKLIYDAGVLRYGKILVATDADPDGDQIASLLYTFFWYFCPELVTNGHIWKTQPPLYRITNKKNEYLYLKDQAALDAYKLQHNGEKYLVNRNKGLGEMDPSELSECLLQADTRHIEQITVADVPAAEKLFEIFMGPNAGLRKDYLSEHSEEATDL